LDDDGYIFDEDGDYVLDAKGNKIKLSSEQIDKFKNNNMIEWECSNFIAAIEFIAFENIIY